MGLREDVEQVLRRGGATPGYVVRQSGDAAVLVEYPDDDDAFLGPVGQPASRVPGEEIDHCDELLQFEGYATEMQPGEKHSALIVYRQP